MHLSGFSERVGIEFRHMKVSLTASVLAWSLAAFAVAIQLQAQQLPPTNTRIYAANNSEALQKQLTNLVAVAKSENKAEVQRLIRNLEIPNYKIWFTKTFGDDKGGGWADGYGRWLAKNEEDFQEIIFKLAHMDGEFVVEKIETANRYGTPKGPLDEYLAKWKAATSRGEEPAPIGDFFFIDGAFRWDANTQYFPFEKPKTGRVTPAKLIQQVDPVYPAEALEKKIEGTVKLQVLIGKDGTVTVENVIEGDPLLSPAAVEAVRKWRCEPWQLNGQAIEMQSTVEVVFSLTPSH